MKALYTLRSTDGKIMQRTDAWKELGTFTGVDVPLLGDQMAATWFKLRGKLWCAARMAAKVVVGKFEADNLNPVAELSVLLSESPVIWSNTISFGGQVVWLSMTKGSLQLYQFDGVTVSTKPVVLPVDVPETSTTDTLVLSTFGGQLAILPSSLSMLSGSTNAVRTQSAVRSSIYLLDMVGTAIVVTAVPLVPSSTFTSFVPSSPDKAEAEMQSAMVGVGIFNNAFIGLTTAGKLFSFGLTPDRHFLADMRPMLPADQSARTASLSDGSEGYQIVLEDRSLGLLMPMILGARVVVGSGEYAGISGTIVDVLFTDAVQLKISSGSANVFPVLPANTEVTVTRGVGGGVGSPRCMAETGLMVSTAFHAISGSMYGFVFGRQLLLRVKLDGRAQPGFILKVGADNRVTQSVLPLNAWSVQTIQDVSDNSVHIIYYDSESKSVRHAHYNTASEILSDLGDVYLSDAFVCLPAGGVVSYDEGELDIVLGNISANVAAGTVSLAYEVFSDETDFWLEVFYCIGGDWKPASEAPKNTRVAGIFTHLLRVDEPTFNGDIQYKVNVRRI